MSKLIVLIFLSISLFARDIPLAHVETREFSTYLELNSKIVQLSNSKQSISSLLSGHVKKYYVAQASKVKSGQKVALIDSFELSKITSEYVALKKQLQVVKDNYNSTKKLFDKGMASKKDLNEQLIQKNSSFSNFKSLESKLKTLDIDTRKLKSGTSSYVLRAHIDGTVSDILQPQHSSVSAHTPLVNIVNDDGYYLKSYVPLSYSQRVHLGQKIVFNYGENRVETFISKILPELDSQTQRIVVLSPIPKNDQKFFVGSFISSIIYFNENKSYKSIKKSALSFFNNEWVVFVPTNNSDLRYEESSGRHDSHDEHKGHNHSTHEEGEKESHDEHKGHNHSSHEEGEKESHDEHEGHNHSTHEEESHDEHEGHEEESHGSHEDEEPMYEPRVVKIITEDNEYVAIEGLELEEKYVSAKSYYVKSLLLKSSLGGHGH